MRLRAVVGQVGQVLEAGDGVPGVGVEDLGHPVDSAHGRQTLSRGWNTRPPTWCCGGMTLEGEYEPSPSEWVRDQVEKYEATGGQEANILRGNPEWPIVVITSKGAKSGKLRKNPVMRVEKDGVTPRSPRRAARPSTRPGTTTSSSTPRSTSRTAPSRTPTARGSPRARSAPSGGSARSRSTRRTPSTRRRPTARSRSSCSSASDATGVALSGPCARWTAVRRLVACPALARPPAARGRPRRRDPSRPRRRTRRATPRTSPTPTAGSPAPGGQLQNPAYLPALVAGSRRRRGVDQLLTQVASPTRLGAHPRQPGPRLERRQPAARRLGRDPRPGPAGRVHQPVRRAAARHRLPAAAGRARPVHRRAAARAVPRRGDHRGLGPGLGGHVRVARPGPRRARLRRAHLRRAGPGHQRDAPARGLAARTRCRSATRSRARVATAARACPSQQLSNFVVGTEDALDFFTSTPDAPLRATRSADGAEVDGVQPVLAAVRPLPRPAHGDAGPHHADRDHRALARRDRGLAGAGHRPPGRRPWWRSTSCQTGLDGRRRAGNEPVVPALAIQSEYGFTVSPWFLSGGSSLTPQPSPEGRTRAASARPGTTPGGSAGVDSMLVVPRASTHLEYTDIPLVLPGQPLRPGAHQRLRAALAGPLPQAPRQHRRPARQAVPLPRAGRRRRVGAGHASTATTLLSFYYCSAYSFAGAAYGRRHHRRRLLKRVPSCANGCDARDAGGTPLGAGRADDDPPGRWVAFLTLASIGLWAGFFGPIQVLLAQQAEAIDADSKKEILVVVLGLGAFVVGRLQPGLRRVLRPHHAAVGRRLPWVVGGAVGGALSLLVLSVADSVVGDGARLVRRAGDAQRDARRGHRDRARPGAGRAAAAGSAASSRSRRPSASSAAPASRRRPAASRPATSSPRRAARC